MNMRFKIIHTDMQTCRERKH